MFLTSMFLPFWKSSKTYPWVRIKRRGSLQELRDLKGTRRRKEEQGSNHKIMVATVNLGINFVDIILDAKNGRK